MQVEPETFTWGCYISLAESFNRAYPRRNCNMEHAESRVPTECMRYFVFCRQEVIIYCTVAAVVNQKVRGGNAAAAHGAQAMRKLCTQCSPTLTSGLHIICNAAPGQTNIPLPRVNFRITEVYASFSSLQHESKRCTEHPPLKELVLTAQNIFQK